MTHFVKSSELVSTQLSSLEATPIAIHLERHVKNTHIAALTILHTFELCNSIIFIDPNLGFWLKPMSTIWFHYLSYTSMMILDGYFCFV